MCSDAAIQISHVTSSSPSTFDEARARRPAGARARAQRAARPAGHHLDQQRRARAPRASRAEERYLASAMSLYDLVADLPLDDRRLRARRPRPHRVLAASSACPRSSRLQRRRRGGRAARTSPTSADAQDAQQAAGPVLDARRRVDVRLASPSTSATLDLFPGYTPEQAGLPQLPPLGRSSRRRWTSRCARPGTSLHEVLGRDAAAGARSSSPRGWASRRRSTPSRAGSRATRTCASSSTRTPDWTDELIDELVRDRRRRLDRLQGRLQGHASSTSRPTRRSTGASPSRSRTPGSRTPTSRPRRRATRSRRTRTGSPGTRRSTPSTTSSTRR